MQFLFIVLRARHNNYIITHSKGIVHLFENFNNNLLFVMFLSSA